MGFFFSSRRRHTRCSRDWSSDVCSSDLGLEHDPLVGGAASRRDRDVAHVWRHRRLRAWALRGRGNAAGDRKSTRLNSSHGYISYAVFCLKKKKKKKEIKYSLHTDKTCNT